MSNTPWMEIAKKEMGVHEIPGRQDNPRIIDYLESTDYPLPNGFTDEIPWCSAFCNWCLEQVHIPGTNSAWSQSWRHWGVELNEPKKGAIIVFHWSGNKGHVGFIQNIDDDNGVIVLGGNQNDSVNLTYFSYNNVVAYRWPKGVDDA